MPTTSRGVSALGLAILVTAGVAPGCFTSSRSQPQTIPASPAQPVVTIPASTGTQADEGVAEWDIYVGLNRAVVSGFDSNGSAVSGLDLSAVSPSAGSLAFVRLTLLDGTDTAVFHLADGEDDGAVSSDQALFLAHAVVDMTVYAAHASCSGGASGGCVPSAATAAIPIEAGGIACTLGQTGAFSSALATVAQQSGGASVTAGIPGCGEMADAMATLVQGCLPSPDAGCVLNPSTGNCFSGGFGVMVGDGGGTPATDASSMKGDAMTASDAGAAADAGGTGDAGTTSGDGGPLEVTTAGQTAGIVDMANNQACPSCPAGAQQLVMSEQNGYVETTIYGDYGYGGIGFVVVGTGDFSQDGVPVGDVSQDNYTSQDSQDSQDTQDSGSQDSQGSQDAGQGSQDDFRRHTGRKTAWSRLRDWLSR
jgi:hypothetical protein